MIEARALLEGLVGQEIETFTGRTNRVLHLEGDEVWVGTERSPAGQPVRIEWVQDGIDRLETEGSLVIDVPTLGHRSAFVGAVLLQIPDVVKGPEPQTVHLVRSR